MQGHINIKKEIFVISGGCYFAIMIRMNFMLQIVNVVFLAYTLYSNYASVWMVTRTNPCSCPSEMMTLWK
jgi:hypothetical protein